MDTPVYNKQKDIISIATSKYKIRVHTVGDTPRRFPTPKNTYYSKIKKIHTHFTYEVFFVNEGKLKLITEHSTNDYENSILIVPPKFKHISVPLIGESFCLLFSFEKTSKEISEFEKLTKDNVLELKMTEEIAFYIEKFAEKIEENSETEAYHLASLLFENIFKNIRTDKVSAEKKVKSKTNNIGNIEVFINRNINKKITLKDVSKNIFLSEKQISRIIEKEYGCTFSELLTEKRLAIAEVLLKTTDMKISDIASQTFYGTESYFYTVFKNKYGVSPLKYRNITKK